jgi:hypothetical protein
MSNVPEQQPEAAEPPAEQQAAVPEPIAAPNDGGNVEQAGEQQAPDVNEPFADLSGMDFVAAVAKSELEADATLTRDTPISSKELFSRASSRGVQMKVSENTFMQYVSNLAKKLESPVTSTGRGRGGGYYLSQNVALIVEEATTSTGSHSSASTTEWGKEKWLYPSLVSWMIGEGYQSLDTSAMRSRSLGKWGNPDVTGILVNEFLSRHELEVVTVEAKVGFDAWEVDFFQAVSQRRFANRSYFAFALPEDAADKLPSDLRYYSERFQVGVLAIDFSNELYERLTKNQLTDDDKTALRDDDGSSVREVLSAPWNHVPLSYQQKICEALEIKTTGELHRWGRSPQ